MGSSVRSLPAVSLVAGILFFAAACSDDPRGSLDASRADARDDAGEARDADPITDTGSDDTGVGLDVETPIDTGVGLDVETPIDTGFMDAEPADTGFPDAEPAETGPTDTGPTDTGPGRDVETPIDTGVPSDTGVAPADAGDAAVRPDTGFAPDTGLVPDSGIVPANDEGQPCTPGPTPQGSCTTPGSICQTWSPTGAVTPVSSCILRCGSDADCAGISSIGPVCANVAFDVLPGGVIEPVRACVSGLAGEGATITTSLRHGLPMTGCPDPYQAYPWFIGSFLFALPDDQRSCGQPCAIDADCTGALTPVCGLNVLGSTVAPGVCQTRHAGKGGLCSQQNVTQMCDVSRTRTSTDGATFTGMVCINLGLTESHNISIDEELGFCIEICDLANPCVTRSDPALAPSCEFGFFTSAAIGVCDDNCRAFPDTCKNPGSAPEAGGVLNGASCQQFGGTFSFPNQGLCLDVSQNETLFDPWDFISVPPVPCEADAHRCPDATTCLAVDFGGFFSSVCIYGCNTTTATTGCAGTAFPNCSAVFGPGVPEGVCMP